MKFNKTILAASIATSLLGLNACGISPQDGGEQNGKAVSGLAIDGYVYAARVYVDTNENNKLDVWEPRAITDSAGYFSYNPVTGVNYCESGNDDDLEKCLHIPSGIDEAVIRVINGKDRTTIMDFTGSLTMRVTTADVDVMAPTKITPIVSLMASMTDAEKANFLTAEGIVDADVAKDFLDFSAGNTDFATAAERTGLLELAFKIHKVADMIAGRLNLEFDQDVLANPGDNTIVPAGFFGSTTGVANDVSDIVYQNIASQISDTVSATTVLSDATIMDTVVTNSYQDLIDLVESYNDDKRANAGEGALDADLNLYLVPAAVDATVATDVAADAKALADAAVTVFATDLADEDDAASRMKAIDTISYLMREGHDRNSAATATAISLATTDATYLTNLRNPAVSLSSLRSTFIANGAAVTAADADYSAVQPISNLLSDLSSGFSASETGGTVNTEGLGGNALNISEGTDTIAIAFDSETPDADSGTMTIDASFADGLFADSSTEGGTETGATELTGTWEQIDEYTMVMNVDVGGTTQPVIIKPTLDDLGNPSYYFDMGSEEGIWAP